MLSDILKLMGKTLPIRDEDLVEPTIAIGDEQGFANVEVESRDGGLRLSISVESHRQGRRDGSPGCS